MKISNLQEIYFTQLLHSKRWKPEYKNCPVWIFSSNLKMSIGARSIQSFSNNVEPTRRQNDSRRSTSQNTHTYSEHAEVKMKQRKPKSKSRTFRRATATRDRKSDMFMKIGWHSSKLKRLPGDPSRNRRDGREKPSGLMVLKVTLCTANSWRHACMTTF